MQKFSILSLRKFLGGVVIIYQVIKTTDSPEILLFFTCGYLLLGIIFLVIGVCIGHHYRKQRRKDIVTVPVKVVKVEMKTVSTSQNGDYNTVQSMSYFPVFRYDYAGRIQEVESNFGQTTNVYHAGQDVEVYIDRETGKFCGCPVDDKAKKAISAIFTTIGCIMLSLVIILGLVYINENNISINFWTI